MSTSLQENEQNEQKPTLHEFLSQASNVKSCTRVNGSYCKRNNGLHVQSEANNVMCDDGTKMLMCKCKSCDASMWKCTACGTMKNMRKDRKPANRHERLCHNISLNPRLGSNTIDENAIEERDEENVALNCDFEMNELDVELNETNFLSDLSLEDHQFNFFIKHLDKNMARKHFFARPFF